MENMERINLKKGSRPHRILKCLALGGGILIIASLSPTGGVKIIQTLLKYYFRKRRLEKERFLQDLKRLQGRKLIEYKEGPDGKIEIKLLKQGKALLMKYNLGEIQLDKKTRWDGKWRLVMFDIPHTKKKARDALRRKLREIDFYPLQKSVFIAPYPCENEIDFIGSIFEVRKYILILYVSRFEGEEKLKHYFKI